MLEKVRTYNIAQVSIVRKSERSVLLCVFDWSNTAQSGKKFDIGGRGKRTIFYDKNPYAYTCAESCGVIGLYPALHTFIAYQFKNCIKAILGVEVS